MSRNSVRTERSEGIDIVVLDRPPANAIDLETMSELKDVVHERLHDSSTDALVVTGTGDFFSAGLDLNSVPQYDSATNRTLVACLTQLVYELYGAQVPVIAAVNGHAVAAGTLLTLTCDYRVGPAEPYRFGLTGARVGIPYPPAALAIFEAELSPSARRRALLGAQTFDSETAQRFGILDELCPQQRVMSRSMEIASEMRKVPRDAYATLKQRLRQGTLARIGEGPP